MAANHVTRYYAHLTDQYRAYAGAAHGWHWGLQQNRPLSHHAALLCSNEALLRGIEITPATRLLDIGCGDGGFAVWAAARFGCSVTGVTICAAHLPLAREQARERGVSDRCVFRRADMNDLCFPSDTFDVIVNQESFCYAVDKKRYLARLSELLVPGGVWMCIDSFVPDDRPLSRREARLRRLVYGGFHFPSLPTPSAMRRDLRAVGFGAIRTRDLTRAVIAHWRSRFENPLGAALRTLVGESWYAGSPARRRDQAAHFAATEAFIDALRWRVLVHRWYSARKPLRERPSRIRVRAA